jgi:hypothetical protein
MSSGKYNLNVFEGSFLDIEEQKPEWKDFDVVMGNPPYQKKVGVKKSEPVWNKFVLQSLNLILDGGFLSFIHPSGWRDVDGKFKDVQREMLSRNLMYLEIHNEADGASTFHSATRYDWYILQNKMGEHTKTTIQFEDELITDINLKGMEFIPNGKYLLISSLISHDKTNSVITLHDWSSYETRKPWMSKERTEENKYPCIYVTNKDDKIRILYSSKKGKHFGVSKLIWSNGDIRSRSSVADYDGKYGLTQFAYAIMDSPNVLNKIKEAFDSEEFREMMVMCAVGQANINHKIIALFKKDFWKAFVPENEERGISEIVEEKKEVKSVSKNYTIPQLKQLLKDYKGKGHKIEGLSKNKKQLQEMCEKYHLF